MADLLSYALTTVADVKELLDISSGDTSKDNLIKRKINQATLMIENYCGRRFALTEYTGEEYDGTNIDQLILKQRPVNYDDGHTLTLYVRDTVLNDDDWTTVDSDLYFVDANAGVLDLNFGATGRWNQYKVDYWAGYSTIPADIAEACAILAGFLTENATTGSNVKRKTEGQRSIEYFDSKSSSTGSDVFSELNIDGIVNSYSNMPILADK